MYIGTYNRLNLRVTATTREVLRALYQRLIPDAIKRENRTARHAIARAILCNHANAKKLFSKVTR